MAPQETARNGSVTDSTEPLPTASPMGIAPAPMANGPATVTGQELAAGAVRWICPPDWLDFETTAEVPSLDTTVGQPRAVEALAFGVGMDQPGYNLFVAGPTGSGRTTTARAQVAQIAATRPPASDWGYLHNFDTPNEPVAVQLPSGAAPALQRDLDELIAACRRDIPRVFESDQYQQRRAGLGHALGERRGAVFEQVSQFATSIGFAVEFTPTGVATVPLLEPGKPLSPEAFELLPDERKVDIRARGQQLERRIEEALLAARRLERDAHEQLLALDREAVGFAVGHVFDALRSRYTAVAPVVQHLAAVQADLVEHLDEFRPDADAGSSSPFPTEHAYERYRLNVLVANNAADGAPVVFEPNPTYYNLLGRIDYRATMGAMATDYRLVRAGALHRANGGFVLVQARDVLSNPFAWDALKRALRDHELRIENLGEQYSAIPTAGLKPQPIPLNVKVVLVGDDRTYLLLHGLDPDFETLFKVKAQFGPSMPRTLEAVHAYAGFVSTQAHARGLLPFGRDAVARVVEHGARLAEHQARLATAFDPIAEVLVEADFEARRAGAETVAAAHVDAALAAREHRLDLYAAEARRLIEEGTVAIETRGTVVGQVNGLSVVDLGDYQFAHPSRITARVGLGDDGLVNIEREVEMSGPTHSKGVLILKGYLLGQYGHDTPLALSARLTFEQTYGGVDGDSASSAELYALLSGLAEAPLRQGIAVTGSVNQRGEIQAIGAATTKIEGFFAICQAQGLDGTQGVLIPATNAPHLMLKPEVVEAIRAGQFHVWTARTIDEGIALLTGVPAGVREPHGSFPADSVHGRVAQRLREMAAQLAAFQRPGRRDGATPRRPNAHAPGAVPGA